eukprot:10327200-Lingulodinium_polyedra.AAC.1
MARKTSPVTPWQTRTAQFHSIVNTVNAGQTRVCGEMRWPSAESMPTTPASMLGGRKHPTVSMGKPIQKTHSIPLRGLHRGTAGTGP